MHTSETPYPHLVHHGAAHGVTGSCHQLDLNAHLSLLIDCGLYQGREAGEDTAIGFPVEQLGALVLTHVHIDHIGRLPYLIAAGFSGPILCSEPSARLLPLVLEDAMRLTVSRDRIFIERFIQRVQEQVVSVPYDHWHSVVETPDLNCRIRLQRAGHILGSAYVECDIDYPGTEVNRRVVFSGDLGAPSTPLLRPPKSPERADILVLESTYGDRLHEDRSTRQGRLEAIIDKALEDHGTVLIPAFSIGRTQELLYELEDILHRKALCGPAQSPEEGIDRQPSTLPVDWPQLPIILDSPLAGRFTQAYRELKPFWNQEALERVAVGRKPLAFNQLITLNSHDDHLRTVNYLASTGRPAIVIAGNGMCSGGRIVNYLKRMLGDPRHNVVFVGYQAQGTPGRVIQACEGISGFVNVDLDGESHAVRAGIVTLGGYSAHADQQGLVDFVRGIPRWPQEIHLVHGEERAKKQLRKRLDQEQALLDRANPCSSGFVR
jgi:metallo-beta-lactamase family protein